MRATKSLLMFLLISASAVFGDETDEILKLAEQDDVQAQFLIGKKYLNGDGIDKSTTEAVKWLTKAGEQGNTEAQMTLGALFIDGRTVPKNSFESAKWYQFAALQNDPAAQRQLARMHLAGAGVVKDDIEAYKWASLASDQGRSGGQGDHRFPRETNASATDRRCQNPGH